MSTPANLPHDSDEDLNNQLVLVSDSKAEEVGEKPVTCESNLSYPNSRLVKAGQVIEDEIAEEIIE